MNYLLVTWMDNEQSIQEFHDQDEAIETLKDVKPYMDKASLYFVYPDGTVDRIEGW